MAVRNIFLTFAAVKRLNSVSSFVLKAAIRVKYLTGIQVRFSISSHTNRFRGHPDFDMCPDAKNKVFMERILRKLFLLLFIVLASTKTFAETDNAAGAQFDWNPVMDAIIQVESSGNSKAVSGNSCGAMQITPILVKECNDILKKRKSKKRFKLSDRFNVAKSKEMFLIFQSFHNPLNNVEQAIRSWNGGLRYSVKGTQRYFNKVMELLK